MLDLSRIPFAPFYRDGQCVLYNADCAEILPYIEHVDAVICDPPFGIEVLATGGNVAEEGRMNTVGGRNYVSRGNRGTSKMGGKDAHAREWAYSEWDSKPADQSVLDRLREISKHQIIWGGNYFKLPPNRGWLVWNKKNEGTTFADCELAWTNLDMAVRMFSYRWNGMLQERSGYNKEVRIHPTQKPVALMRWCLGFVPKAKVILDPYAGSCSSLVAAKLEGRFCIGIERDLSYCKKAVGRLSQGVLTGLND